MGRSGEFHRAENGISITRKKLAAARSKESNENIDQESTQDLVEPLIPKIIDIKGLKQANNMRYYHVKYSGTDEYQWASQKYLDDSNIIIPKQLFDDILSKVTWMNKPRQTKKSTIDQDDDNGQSEDNTITETNCNVIIQDQKRDRLNRANMLMFAHFEDSDASGDENIASVPVMSQSVTNSDYFELSTKIPKIESNAISDSLKDTHHDMAILKEIGFDLGINRTWQDIIPGISSCR